MMDFPKGSGLGRSSLLVASLAMIASMPCVDMDLSIYESCGHSEDFDRWQPNSGPLPTQAPGNRAKRRQRHKKRGGM